MPAVSDYGMPQENVESAYADEALGKLADNSELTQEAAGALTALPADAAAELAKWRARVPKLANALKDRAAQVQALQAELDKHRLVGSAATSVPSTPTDSEPDAGTRARLAQLDELERKYNLLNQRHQQTAGELRSREVELEEVREEALSWKVSWEEVTGSLDEQCDLVRQGQQLQADADQELHKLRELTELQATQLQEQAARIREQAEQSQSLESRNTNLLESVELANRQIETLGEDLSGLQDKRVAAEIRVDDLLENQTELQNQLVERRGRVLTLQEDLASVRQRLSEVEQQVMLGDQAKAAFRAQLEAQRQQSMLEVVEIQAEHSQQLRDVHAQTLLLFEAVDEQWLFEHQQMQEQLQQEITRLDNDLEENTTTLAEQESQRSELQAASSLLAAQLDAANRRCENLRAARTDEATAQRFALAANLASLEQVLAQPAPVAQAESSQDEAAANVERLEQEIQTLEQRLEECLARPFQAHELTRLKGVGEKTAEQLCELGFATLQSIAILKRDVLSSPIHPLHSLRGRVLHDSWIEQAQDLIK